MQFRVRDVEPSRGGQLYPHFCPALRKKPRVGRRRAAKGKLDAEWRQEQVSVSTGKTKPSDSLVSESTTKVVRVGWGGSLLFYKQS